MKQRKSLKFSNHSEVSEVSIFLEIFGSVLHRDIISIIFPERQHAFVMPALHALKV